MLSVLTLLLLWSGVNTGVLASTTRNNLAFAATPSFVTSPITKTALPSPSSAFSLRKQIRYPTTFATISSSSSSSSNDDTSAQVDNSNSHVYNDNGTRGFESLNEKSRTVPSFQFPSRSNIVAMWTALMIITTTVTTVPVATDTTAWAAYTVSPVDQSITTYTPSASSSTSRIPPAASSSSSLPSTSTTMKSATEPAEKKAVTAAKNALETASSKVLQAQKDVAAAKLNSEKAVVAMSKAEAANKLARTTYLNANDKLLQMKTDRNVVLVKESVIIQQQQKVGT
jgi:hypothetical protein